ncbi:MAG: ACP S-malonyltransferase, partial [Pyrinomonadaceae bacterium]
MVRFRQMLIAYIFPGQGSQYEGMGRQLAEQFASAREVFEEADTALGFSLSKLCFEGPIEKLQLTENTQPAILATSIAALRVLISEGFPAPSFVAGHSLGEYSALVASGALDFSTALRLVRARGRYMQEAVPVGVGAMAAILGCDTETVRATCEEVEGRKAHAVCSPANINSPAQIVIAGDTESIDVATELLKQRGARKATRLKVSAPFHCAMMKPAEKQLAEDLGTVKFNDLQVPLVTNVDARLITGGEDARESLIRQVSLPVRWSESMSLLVTSGVRKFVEIGPGKVLCSLVKANFKSAGQD